jgi:hypothetical protein
VTFKKETPFAEPFVQGNNYFGCSHEDFSTLVEVCYPWGFE